MNEDPVISGGVVKAALVLLVAGALGVGAYAIAGDGLDLDLPDLPDLETVGDEGITELQDTNLTETEINGSGPPEGADPFSTAGFGAAMATLTGEIGPGAELTRLFVNEVQTQFIVRRGDGVEAYSFRADTGELERQDATITFSGNATIEDFLFRLGGVEPAAVDRMLASARKQSGAADFEPTVLSLERGIPFGERKLEWTINAQGDGRNLLYRASADGTGTRNVGGEGTAIPPAAIEAQKLNDCIQAAQSDPDAIFECLDRFR